MSDSFIHFWPLYKILFKVYGCCCCCCCCWVASVMSDSVRPHGLQPTRLPRPWDSPGKNTGVGCHFLLQCVKAESESDVAQSCLTLSDPWTAAHQAPLSMGPSRQEYWSGVPLPSPKYMDRPQLIRPPTDRQLGCFQLFCYDKWCCNEEFETWVLVHIGKFL